MEYGRILRGAWTITARTRALWWLGAIAAAQVAVYSVVVAGLTAPLSVMPGFASTIASVEAGTSSGLDSARAQPLFTAAEWLGAHLDAVVIGAIAVFSAWLVLGVLDVAAQVGIVTQVDAVAERRSASLATGLRDGFRLWWRAVALLALAALPTLVYLLVMALLVLFAVTLPLYLGQPPHAGAALVSNLVLAPLSGVVSLVSVPLVVLVQLAMRFAVIDDSALAALVRRRVAPREGEPRRDRRHLPAPHARHASCGGRVRGGRRGGRRGRRGAAARNRHSPSPPETPSRPGALRCGGPPDSPRSCSLRFRLSCSYGSPRCGRSSGATGPDAARRL